jgi:hypothetical protein
MDNPQPNPEINGYIYVILCSKSPKVYVGQTLESLRVRFNKHLSDARSYHRKLTDPNYTSGKKRFCAKLCRAMNKYGLKNFSIHLVEEVSIDIIDETECMHIEEFDSVNNGYNLQSGGNRSSHSVETRQVISERTSIGISKNITSYRKHNIILEGVPKHCVLITQPGKYGIAVNKHPLCKWRLFSVKKYGNIDNAKIALKEFLNEIETSNIHYVYKRK